MLFTHKQRLIVYVEMQVRRKPDIWRGLIYIRSILMTKRKLNWLCKLGLHKWRNYGESIVITWKEPEIMWIWDKEKIDR